MAPVWLFRLLFLALTLFAGAAFAQSWQAKPICLMAYVRSEIELWAKLVKAAGSKAD